MTRLTRRGRAVVLALVGLGLCAVLGAGVSALGLASFPRAAAADYPGPGGAPVTVQVHAGDTTTAIGQTLRAAGVVASVAAFQRAAAHDPKALTIEPGFYSLRLQMRAAAALALLESPAGLLRNRVSVPEGTSLRRLLPLLAGHTRIPLAAFTAAVAAPAALGLPAYAQGSVEGFLFPATYDVPPTQTAAGLLSAMVARFVSAADGLNLTTAAAAEGLTPLQAVTLASIVQRESAAPADEGKVARVFLNRIKVGLPLGSSFTVAYTGNDPASPYNTYTHKGVPPGPYDSPGTAALQAVLQAPAGPWLYFVTQPGGGTVFTTTFSAFEHQVALCRAAGGCR